MTSLKTYRTTAQVGPGHRIEFVAPELAEGERVEIFVVPQEVKAPERSFLQTIDAFPPGPRSAATWEEIEANLQADRNAWDC